MTPREHILNIKGRLRITKPDDGHYTPLHIKCDDAQVMRFGPVQDRGNRELDDEEILLCCADILYGYGCRAEDAGPDMRAKMAQATSTSDGGPASPIASSDGTS